MSQDQPAGPTRSRPVAFRVTGWVLLVGLAGVCTACGGDSLSGPAADLLPRINADPAELPPAVDERGAVVMLLLGVDPRGNVVVDGAPVPVDPHSMRFARAMTLRRTAPPAGWALIREDGADTIRYWVPLDPDALIRANIRAADAPDHSPHLERVPVMFSSLRVPFFPRAEVEFVRANGTAAGTFRFGDRPVDPMQAVR